LELCGVNEVSFDRVDLRILDILQADAGLSNQDLAEKVAVSPATCLRRVRRLIDVGVLTRRVALLDPERLGPSLQVICEVTLDRQSEEHAQAFMERTSQAAAVQQCYRVSPGPDFILIAAVSDMAAWRLVVARLFTQDANVRNVKTFFVTHRGRFETAWPLPSEVPNASE
jgi:Lrp/AsnC family transcriptional regulator, leucine-responsive regulatory protein